MMPNTSESNSTDAPCILRCLFPFFQLGTRNWHRLTCRKHVICVVIIYLLCCSNQWTFEEKAEYEHQSRLLEWTVKQELFMKKWPFQIKTIFLTLVVCRIWLRKECSKSVSQPEVRGSLLIHGVTAGGLQKIFQINMYVFCLCITQKQCKCEHV